MADRPDVPPKLFFRIGEVAGLVGVEPHVLRYWEREFRSIRPTKSAKGQRVYSRKDVENLLRVRDLLYRDGFTIAGAKKKLQRGGVEQVEHATHATHATHAAHAPEVTTYGRADGRLHALEHTPFVDRVGVSRSEPAPLRTEPPLPPLALAALAPLAPASEPVAPAPASGTSARSDVREKLTALRSEVEGFLAELTKAH